MSIGKVLKTAGKVAIVVGPPMIKIGSELKKGSKPKDIAKKAIKEITG